MLQKLIQNYSYTYWDAQDVYRKSVTLTYLARSLGHITFYDVTTLTIRGVLTHNQHLYVLYQACCAFEMSWGSQGGGEAGLQLENIPQRRLLINITERGKQICLQLIGST